VFNFLNPDNYLLEGHGKINIDTDGNLIIETFRIRPDAKATNVWLTNFELPDNFEAKFSFKSTSENGNTMIIFNALPVGLINIFDDERIDARYCDLASHRKMQAYTVGFHRSVSGRPSVLRKLGGMVPLKWGDAVYPSPAWKEMDSITTISSVYEPTAPEEKGNFHHYHLIKTGNRIIFKADETIVHDYIDNLEYPYCDNVLKNGCIGFRNFSGPAIDIYSELKIKAIKD